MTDKEKEKYKCPYDLNTVYGAIMWQRDLFIHWHKEALKISYPDCYKAYRKSIITLKKLYAHITAH